jgi:hypothetical protein
VLAQLGHGRDPEELHGGLELPEQQVESAVHAGLAAGHQPVQVGAAEHGGVRAERQGDRHVGAVPHAGVDQHRERGPHRLPHRRDEVNRGDRPVQLPPAVVGQLHPVHPEFNRPPCVRGSYRPLQQQLARPPGAQLRDIRPVQVGVEEIRRLHHRRRRPSGEVGVVERGAGQQVVPVGRFGGHRGHRLQRQRGRDGQPVAQVTHPVAPHDGVDGDHEGRVPVIRRPGHEFPRLWPVPGQVQLKPQVGASAAGACVTGARAGHARPQLLEAGRCHRGQRVRDPVPQRRAGRADLPVRVQHPRVPGRAKQEGRRQRLAEQWRGRIRCRHAGEHPGQEPPGPEGGDVGGDRDLLIGGPVHVVEHRPGNAPFGRPPQVGDVVTGAQPPCVRVGRHRAQLDKPAHLPHLHAGDDTPARPACEDPGVPMAPLSACAPGQRNGCPSRAGGAGAVPRSPGRAPLPRRSGVMYIKSIEKVGI